MTKNETRLWINYHHSLFPDWTYSADSIEAKALAFNSFAKALAQIDVADAQEASDRMLAGTIKTPFHNSDHLAGIIAACKQIVSHRYASEHQAVGGERTVSCQHCSDTGFVTLEYPPGLRSEKSGLPMVGRYTMLCCCERGQRQQKTEWGRNGRLYDPNGPKPENYEPAFADYS